MTMAFVGIGEDGTVGAVTIAYPGVGHHLAEWLLDWAVRVERTTVEETTRDGGCLLKPWPGQDSEVA